MNSALYCFLGYMAAVFVLAFIAGRVGRGKPFVGEYYLGGRNFGMWAFALTYAATLASGGSFMGFPALIYTHGWSLAWWISGYMVVPLVALGLFAKRINQVGRIANAITIPELLRKRFASNSVGNTATLLLVLFMFFYLLAQFKAGALIMATLFEDVPLYQSAVAAVGRLTDDWFWVGSADPGYLVCLCVFAVAVVVYTAYGGFRAVVWTDVLQGMVMLAGVLILLALTLSQVGGLGNATRQLAKQTPPESGLAILDLEPDADADRTLAPGDWLSASGGEVVRLKETVTFSAHSRRSGLVEVLIVTTPSEREALRDQTALNVSARVFERKPYAAGAGQEGTYLTAPGPHPSDRTGFLPVLLALSFFAFWTFSGAGQPSYMVRQMAFRDTVVLRRSILFVAVFFTLIYLPLIFIFTSARVLMPGAEIDADRIMPELATVVTAAAGVPWLAGILVAAPFAAIMSSVDSFLLLVSSGVVRDIYQQNARRGLSEKAIARLSRGTTLAVGVMAVVFILNPPAFLQTLIVFASGGLGASFLMPMIMALYWKRTTAPGAVAGMISGAFVMLVLYLVGWNVTGEFGEYNLFGLHPFIWASLANLLALVAVSLQGKRPDDQLVAKFFGT